MKRFLALFLVVIMALGCFAFQACDGEGDATSAKPTGEPTSSHTHKGGIPTCKDKAVCTECGKAYGELAAHDYGEDGRCKVCGASKSDSDDQGNGNVDAAQAAADVIEQIKALEAYAEITDENYERANAMYETALRALNALNAEASALVGNSDRAIISALKRKILDYEEALKLTDPVRYYELARRKLPVIKTYKGTVAIDGEIDAAILEKCTPMMINKELCDEWSKSVFDDGAGVFGDTSLVTNADTKVSFYIAYDDENLYVIEKRSDLTWNFTAADHTQSYTGDGSILWFVDIGNVDSWMLNGGIEEGSEPSCGLMWAAGTSKQTVDNNKPMVGYFPYDDQSAPEEKLIFNAWESGFKWNSDKSEYVLEVAIPWSELPFSAKDIENGDIAATFCSVDIVNSAFDGSATNLWSGMGYQMQYPGCTRWCWSESLVVNK